MQQYSKYTSYKTVHWSIICNDGQCALGGGGEGKGRTGASFGRMFQLNMNRFMKILGNMDGFLSELDLWNNSTRFVACYLFF